MASLPGEMLLFQPYFEVSVEVQEEVFIQERRLLCLLSQAFIHGDELMIDVNVIGTTLSGWNV